MKVFFRSVIKIFVLAAFLAPITSCVNYSKIELTSFNVSSISPSGLKGVSCVLEIGVDNGASGFVVYDMDGVVYKSGKEIGTLAADPVVVAGHKKDTYSVQASMTVSNVSIMDLISILKNLDIDEFTVDLNAKVKSKGGAAQKLALKDVPARKLVKFAKTYGV